MKKQIAAMLAVAVAVAVTAVPARAAELFYMDHDALTHEYVGPVGPLVISGDIEPGDFSRLLAKITATQDRFLAQNKIIVASDAGDVEETIKIARLVKSLHSQVTVGPLTGRCSGACFLIFAAAVERGTDGEGLIGLRRLPSADDFLHESGVPAYLVTEGSRHPTDVYWLSDRDEKSLGARSPAFVQYLKTRCGWDAALEHEVYAGGRPFSDLSPLLECRARVTRADARKALAAAAH